MSPSRVWLASCCLLGFLLGSCEIVAGAPPAVLFRIFLDDGSTLVSYGEYSQIGERVVFSMPLGVDLVEPRLHLVTVPAARVDWRRTERYAESARYERYVATRAEADFAAMSRSVAQALNAMATAPSAEARLALVEQARAALVEWPRTHFGYRSDDVRQIVGLLDEAILGLRAATGATTFALNLVAIASPPPPMPLLAPPSLQENIAQVLTAASLTPVAAERISLFQSALTLVETDATSRLPRAWLERARELVRHRLETEVATEEAYRALAHATLESASLLAEQADVRGLNALLEQLMREDERLGQLRPNVVAGVVAALDVKLADARELRLARDGWILRRNAFRRYQRAVDDPLREFAEATAMLEDIRQLAGPVVEALPGWQARLDRAVVELAVTAPPADLGGVHELLSRAAQLGASAVEARARAVTTGDLRTAWDASAAASGALMLFARAQTDLEDLLRPPTLR